MDSSRAGAHLMFASDSRRAVARHLLDGDGDLTTQDLLAETGVSRPTLADHLETLCDIGIVERDTTGRQHSYRLADSVQADQFAAMDDAIADDLLGRDDRYRRAMRGLLDLGEIDG